MVEVSFNPVQSTAQNQQVSQVQPAEQQGQGVGGLQNGPDSVVAAADNTQGTNVRNEDASRRRSGDSTGSEGIPSVAAYNPSVTTRIGYDSERNGRVVLEIIETRTGEALVRIPSEGLVEFLESQFRQRSGVSQTIQDEPAVVSVDRQI